jgi:pSer/pThr/pTyr-binding forkhead associated (FHA) protein
MWKLVIEDDEGRRTVVPLTRDQYSIGRKEGNTIRLTERNVSREHARIFKKQLNGSEPLRGDHHMADRSTFVLEDLTSYNGVFVNGLRISHAQDLTHGDLVQIGDYRIILQDEMLADIAGSVPSDAKQTLPNAPLARAATLLDRPNRLVMLAGPTPGAEFPLDRERMTIGRAEDASISINHNSVSRLHCEVHALGDGRFEIVDKGSSNGVRVNSAELRRGIVEAGDVIELGDVKFKFIGAGQIFRPTESQQLALLGDREAHELARGRRGSSVVPIAIFLGVVAAGGAAAWLWARPRAEPPAAMTATPTSPDEALLDEARRLCQVGDCEAAHEKVAGLPEASPMRASQELRDLENRWADQVLARADGEGDLAKRRGMYQRVAQATSVDGSRRKAAADKLQQSDTVTNTIAAASLALPGVGTRANPDDGTPTPTPRADAGARRAVKEKEALAAEPAAAPPAAVPATGSSAANSAATPVRASNASVDDRERQLALQGTPDAKMLLKQQLEQRVYNGRATDTEIKLLISTCKDLGDKLCVQQARSIQQQRQQ